MKLSAAEEQAIISAREVLLREVAAANPDAPVGTVVRYAGRWFAYTFNPSTGFQWGFTVVRRGTCEVCGKVRQLAKYDLYYYACISECYKLDAASKERRRKQKREEKVKTGPRFAYPCIGGPLDGKYACDEDFTTYGDKGVYAEHARAYTAFNASGGVRKRIGGPPSMVYLHDSLLRPLVRGKDRHG